MFFGVMVFAVKPLALVYFVFISTFLGIKILRASGNKKVFYVLFSCAYIVGAEVFLRMNNGTFFYEASKYLVILYSLIGLSSGNFNNKAILYVLYIILLIPSVFVAVSQMGFETNIRKAIAFNLSGPICLGIVAMYCYQKTVSFTQLKIILVGFLLPLISMTVYLFLYTPDVGAFVTSTASNFATSGGFGPNQVATVLGLGMFALASRFFMSKEGIIPKLIDLFVLGLIGFRAIVTFSRGGVITGVVMILAFLLFYYMKVNMKRKFHIKGALLFFLGIVLFTWIYSSTQTSGMIDKRYANQDAAGRTKEDVTTGRAELLFFELNAFSNNPLFGIGVGKVKEIRFNETGVIAASHNEIGRIIAEHGSLGILAFLILLINPLIFRIRNRSNIFFFSFYIFWILTINHSAMRIAAPAFVYGLTLLNIKYDIPRRKLGLVKK
ncbi:O-antigen ligase family protein [Seonamhaeicola marinus]|uniref:O-antigen ligase family protein n=2 Tax=Seonamhaeicola marinus TaxID=1912246 RepID=A0A5D0HKU5_9FLAO|nr:O-antigen ligase family protein [Seonamhaeicola marinus]